MEKIIENRFIKENIEKNGNRFILGNGYLGYRGTLDEFRKKELACLNLPGLFDQVENKTVEPVNSPNPLYTYLTYKDKVINYENFEIKNHSIELNIYSGTVTRITTFIVEDVDVTIESTRFVSHKENNIIGRTYKILLSKPIDLMLYTGIDLDIWDLNGPHLKTVSCTDDNGLLRYIGLIPNKNHYVEEIIKDDLKLEYNLVIDNSYLLKQYQINHNISFNTIVYVEDKKNNNLTNIDLDYKKSLELHLNEISDKWSKLKVTIESDELAEFGVNLSIYHLMIIAPKRENTSISARGVSGQVYKGACFWDTEMFMLPYYLLNDLETSKKIIEYRINTLPNAILKAKSFGYNGAFYAWESVDEGKEGCSFFNIIDVFTNRPIRTYFIDKQIHISGDVVYGIDKYLEITKDYDILISGGMDVIYQVSKFYYSYLLYNSVKDLYLVNDVIGPDEYHERVNNNAYTNKLVEFTFNCLIKYSNLLRKLNMTYENDELESFIKKVKKVIRKIYNPNILNNVIEQFEGYFNLEDVSLSELLKRKIHPNEYLGGNGIAATTQIIKQADVVTMLYMFKDDYNLKDYYYNFNYYHPRTEHGSSLSACMYSLLATMIKEKDHDYVSTAYKYFLDSALIDYYGDGKLYAGNTYIGGTHPASSGGAYMCLVYGFCGLRFKNDKIYLNPNLPENIKKIKFKITYNNKLYEIIVDKKRGRAVCLSS